MDATHFNYENYPDNDSFTDLFTKSDLLDEIKTNLHITKKEEFERTNSTVADSIADRENNAAFVYTELLSRGLKILINVGNYDQKDGVRSTLEWIKQIDFPDREMFDLQPRKVYKYNDQFDGSEKVGGWYRHHDNFTAIVVPQAGHMVPAYQPYVSMQFVKDFITKGYLYCETDENGSCESVAHDMCDYMNDCYGQGTCNSYGKCECDAGFFGADCSSTVTDLTTADEQKVSETTTASRWFYYSVPADADDYEITVSSDNGVSVYVRMGDTELPDPSNFDSFIKNQTSMTFPSTMLDSEQGWMLAVHVQGNSSDVTTNFSIKLNQYQGRSALDTIDFLDLAAAASPAAPMTPLPPSGKKDAFSDEADDLSSISNMQYVLLGALLGCLATVLFYQVARFAA